MSPQTEYIPIAAIIQIKLLGSVLTGKQIINGNTVRLMPSRENHHALPTQTAPTSRQSRPELNVD